MKWTEFTDELIKTEDLDPLYVLVCGTKWPWSRKARFTVAYSMFYHAGVSAELAQHEEDQFWETAIALIQDIKTPRGTERRHYRGVNALTSCYWLQHNCPAPEDWVDTIGALTHWKERYNAIQRAPQFGRWISFKVCDMLDRVLECPTDWNGFDFSKDLYEAPWAGARMIGEREGGSAADAWAMMMERVGRWPAPPQYDRRCGLQEAETVLCKYHAHMGGHYPMGKDTKEIVHGLGAYKHIEAATDMLVVAREKGWKDDTETQHELGM